MPRPAYAAPRASRRGRTQICAGLPATRARYVAVSNVVWAYERFRPYRTIGSNYCRRRCPAAGKSSFFRDRVVIKYGYIGLAMESCPREKLRATALRDTGDVTDQPEPVVS